MSSGRILAMLLVIFLALLQTISAQYEDRCDDGDCYQDMQDIASEFKGIYWGEVIKTCNRDQFNILRHGIRVAVDNVMGEDFNQDHRLRDDKRWQSGAFNRFFLGKQIPTHIHWWHPSVDHDNSV
jgi:hypothetical protein